MLQETLAQKERDRDATQTLADKAMADMNVKLNVFRDPFLDRATETEFLMDKIKELNGESTAAGSSANGSPSRNTGGSSTGAGLSPAGSVGSKGSKGLGSLGTGGLGGRKDHLNDLSRLNDDLRAKAERLNEARRKRD